MYYISVRFLGFRSSNLFQRTHEEEASLSYLPWYLPYLLFFLHSYCSKFPSGIICFLSKKLPLTILLKEICQQILHFPSEGGQEGHRANGPHKPLFSASRELQKVIASQGCQVAKGPYSVPMTGAGSSRCPTMLILPWERQETSSYYTVTPVSFTEKG